MLRMERVAAWLPNKNLMRRGTEHLFEEKRFMSGKNKKEAKVLVRKSIRIKKKAKEASAMLKKKKKV
jgi:hypothetical protein